MKKRNLFFLLRVALVLFAVTFIFLSPAFAQKLIPENGTTTVYLPLVMKNYSGLAGFGSLTGFVQDARTGAVLEGIVVCQDGTTNCSAPTQSDGEYLVQNIANGAKKFTATDPLHRYTQSEEFITIVTNATVELNFNMFPILQENQFRIVLTWDSNSAWPCAPFVCPNDFNLHMWWTSGLLPITYERFDIDNLGNCDDLEVYPNICYESDEQYGSGPEAIAFKYRLAPSPLGIYYVAVLNYYADRPSVPSFFERTPPARVQVFDGSQQNLLLDLSIDPDSTEGTGDLWYVFQLDFGNLITQNCLSQFDQVGDTPPVDCFDLKNIK